MTVPYPLPYKILMGFTSHFKTLVHANLEYEQTKE